MKRNVGAVLLLAAVVTGCTEAGPPAIQAVPRSGTLSVAARPTPIEAPHVAGDRLYGLTPGDRGEILAHGVNATFIATLSPAAVPEPTDRSTIAYNSWEEEGPSLRLFDTASGEDRLIDRGAFSVAWRRDGALAYFKARDPMVDLEAGERPIGHVVVRASPNQEADRWTTKPGNYVVAAWAGERLLVYRIGDGKWPDLLVLERPGRVRLLAGDGALIAVSPEGDRAFLTTYGASPPSVQVVDVAEGHQVSSFAFGGGAPPAARGIRWVVEAGSWVEDLVVAKASPGLVVFRVEPGSIRLDQILRLGSAPFPLGLFEPRLDPSGERIVAWAQLEELPRQPLPDAALVQCDRRTLQCVQGQPLSSGLGLRLVYNPSRP
jgi:hypothetical protein